MYVTNWGMVLLAVVTSQHWSPPHYVMGYSLGEWLALLSILGFFITAISYLVDRMIFSPLRFDIERLSDRISDDNRRRISEMSDIKKLLDQHAKLLDRHGEMLIRHEDYINYQKEEKK
ncbi:hypothetical protein [Lactiplantibacillus mudanjiangensis]|uniref:Uncharacterized protein n=1 Tax=Lactiplantibacillus mudanjiangensis TaxID=1296538 RepID=A0A660DW35_9LACO|nr:hypothetical protein [Lactiplantibacillus mudanjiangensis]VDG26333.1 hypothetical protein [Lactobacillus sp. CBA3605] [Lactiplantibacillus mudanjiangensis]VDG27855.1 hypothetical protein [Lactobacillus sp. CBA3605] [Lactiplantibacillus mudanjiangensis]